MDRRVFLSWFSVGAFATSLPVILAACDSGGGNTQTTTQTNTDKQTVKIDTSVREDGFQALGTVEQLEQDGKILDRNNAAQEVLIFRNGEDNKIYAVNPKCTHQACTVDLDKQNKTLNCPCHGSKFGFDGSLVNGPAKTALPSFETKEEGGLVLVKVG